MLLSTTRHGPCHYNLNTAVSHRPDRYKPGHLRFPRPLALELLELLLLELEELEDELLLDREADLDRDRAGIVDSTCRLREETSDRCHLL